MFAKSFTLLVLCLITACREPPKKPGDGSDDPGNNSISNLPAAVSLQSFKANVYDPILKPYCASCHGASFVDFDAETAHNNFLQRVSFTKFTGVDQTPVILKLKQAHNCWEGETKKCVETMTNGINLWLLDLDAAGYKPTPAVYPNGTKAVPFTSATPATIAIDTTQYASAGVDTATIAEPFAKGTDDVDGNIPSYAMGKAGTAPVNAVGQAQVAQALTFNIDVKAAGTYQVWVRVKTPTALKNGFFVRLNNANLAFDTPVTDTSWKWVQMMTRQGNNNPQAAVIQVAAPAIVQVPILFRAAEAKINYVALTQKVNEFDGEQFANVYKDVAVDLPFPNSKIIATIWEKTTEDGKRSLGVKELRIESPKKIHIKTIYPLINGMFHVNHGTYTLVDVTVGGSTDRKEQIINTGGSNSTTWLADITKDQLSFAFETIEEIPEGRPAG